MRPNPTQLPDSCDRSPTRRWPNRFTPTLAITLSLAITACTPPQSTTQTKGSQPTTQAVVVPARRQAVSENLPLIGTVSANEMVEIKPETDGIIHEIKFEEGQRVEKGQLLLLLDDSKSAASTAEAEANFKLSQVTYERSKQLLKDNLISQQEHDQSAATFAFNQAGLDLKRRQLRDARILAPFTGTIGSRQVSPGQVITRSTTLTWLVDLDSVKVEVELPEKYLGQIQLGQNLSFTVAAYPKEQFPGQIYFIAPQVSETLRTATVKARIPNPKHLLKPGMFASLTLTLVVRESAIVIPEVAIIHNGDQTVVFTVDKADVVSLRSIKIGERLAGKAEVISGLEEGEDLIVEGHQKVGPGSKVRRSTAEKAAPYLK